MTLPVPCPRHEALRLLMIDYRSYAEAFHSAAYAALGLSDSTWKCTCPLDHYDNISFGLNQPLSFSCDLHGCRNGHMTLLERVDITMHGLTYLVPSLDSYDRFPLGRTSSMNYTQMIDYCDRHGERPL